MFTVEMDWDETAIVILDDDGHHEDLQMMMYEDIVYLRQLDDDLRRHNYIVVSPDMMRAFQTAWHLPEGAYRFARKGERN